MEITTSTHLQDEPRTYQRYIEARSRKHPCRAKATCITYSECVSVTLRIQYAKGMHRIVLSLVSCPAVQYFCHIFKNCTIFGKNVSKIYK